MMAASLLWLRIITIIPNIGKMSNEMAKPEKGRQTQKTDKKERLNLNLLKKGNCVFFVEKSFHLFGRLNVDLETF